MQLNEFALYALVKHGYVRNVDYIGYFSLVNGSCEISASVAQSFRTLSGGMAISRAASWLGVPCLPSLKVGVDDMPYAVDDAVQQAATVAWFEVPSHCFGNSIASAPQQYRTHSSYQAFLGEGREGPLIVIDPCATTRSVARNWDRQATFVTTASMSPFCKLK